MTHIAVYTSEACIGRCDTKCSEAQEPDRDCVCGGLNHDAGVTVAIDNTRLHAEAMIEKYAGANGLAQFRAELGQTVEQLLLF
jgi:hypothetical protein